MWSATSDQPDFEVAPAVTGAGRTRGAIGQLDHDQLIASQGQTLNTPRRDYGLGGRILFRLLDAVYGADRTLSKFKVLELVARVPYQSWEQVAYIAITHTHERPEMARRIFDRVTKVAGVNRITSNGTC